MCFLDVAEIWILFCIHSFGWYLLIEEMRSLMLRDINNQLLSIPVIVIVVMVGCGSGGSLCVCVFVVLCFLSFDFTGLGLFIVCFLECKLFWLKFTF